jgi:dinuclear metal center YbgI/SA1388 family protein
MKLAAVTAALESLAPLHLAEPWDNVGLLVGGPEDVARALLCIDYTGDVAREADALGADLVVAYHPVIFQGLKSLPAGSRVADAIRKGRAIWCPHTALDVAEGGTNDVLADAAGMTSRAPLRRVDPARARTAAESAMGIGRVGEVAPCTRRELVERVKAALGLSYALASGPLDAPCARVAVSAGAAGDLLEDALRAGVDVYVTGELRHHDALSAASRGLTVVCLRHSASERAVLRPFGEALRARAPGLEVHVSQADRDPFDLV